MRKSFLRKYTQLCRHFNVDCFDSFSIHQIIILCSKVGDKQELLQKFCHAVGASCNADHKADQQNVFASERDWLNLLMFCTFELENDVSEKYVNTKCVLTMKSCLTQAKLGSGYEISPRVILACIVSMCLENTKNSLMMKHVLNLYSLKDENSQLHDIDFKTLGVVASFFDTVVDQHSLGESLLVSLICMKISHSFIDDLRLVSRQWEMEVQHQKSLSQTRQTRFQLRVYVEHLAHNTDLEYNTSFSNWSSVQNFSNLTTVRRQELLYFFLAQVSGKEQCCDFLTEQEKVKLNASKLATIDASCLVRVIHSIRVYNFKIESLLDFRTQCLQGLSMLQRKKLSLAEVAQLYVCCWQHPSVREECWKSVVSMWNHTVATSCEKFRQNREFELSSVIQLLLASYKDDLQI